LAHRDRPLAHGRLPVGASGERDLAEHEVDHAVHEFVFVGHVLVLIRRHWTNPTARLGDRRSRRSYGS
jgi:hypothetical protein